MIRQVAILLLANLLTSQVNGASLQGNILTAPKNSLDDAKILLNQLYASTLGNIMVAHDKINDLGVANAAHRSDVELNTEFAVQEQSLIIQGKLNAIKSLAQAAGKNISSCLNVQESLLDKLPDVYKAELEICLSSTNAEAKALIDESLYNVDITINTVHELENQLDKCGLYNETCISEVITLGTQQTEEIPIKIEEEVTSASDRSKRLRVNIQNCADSTLSGYALNANSVYLGIVDCVNKIVLYFANHVM